MPRTLEQLERENTTLRQLVVSSFHDSCNIDDPFGFLCTPKGILFHLRLYMDPAEYETDAEHFASLKRGVQHVIDALTPIAELPE